MKALVKYINILYSFFLFTGTIISGLCIFWCAKSRVPPKFDQDPILIACVNLWVGLAQLFTVTFLLVGWFWSVAWGIRMVLLSCKFPTYIAFVIALCPSCVVNVFFKQQFLLNHSQEFNETLHEQYLSLSADLFKWFWSVE